MHNLYTQGPGERVISVYYDPARRKNAARKRVAAYCRVSTDSDAQLGSLENQMAAFRHQVSLHDDWELVQIYADEGISGTSTRHRAGFRQMIADCKAGKIDYIITKSISRFARNTMDCLKYVRELQGMGVQVYFEKEGIDTAGSISEILLTVMAAFAQEESRSISENVKWGMRKRFEAGVEWRVPIYGYRHTEEAMYIIVPEEATIVQEIFTRYAQCNPAGYDRAEGSAAEWEYMEAAAIAAHAPQRKVHGRRGSPKELHREPSDPPGGAQPRRGAPVPRSQCPPGDHRQAIVRVGCGGFPDAAGANGQQQLSLR